jgi:hypothetical protein
MKMLRFTPVKALCGLLIVGIAVFGAINTSRISAQLNDLRQPAPQTSLYFADDQLLPDEYIPGENQSFKFSFVNQERRVIDYSFKIIATDMSASKKVLGSGKATAQNNKIGTVSPSFKMPDMGDKVKITVELSYKDTQGEDQTKSISYWVEQRETKSAQTA